VPLRMLIRSLWALAALATPALALRDSSPPLYPRVQNETSPAPAVLKGSPDLNLDHLGWPPVCVGFFGCRDQCCHLVCGS